MPIDEQKLIGVFGTQATATGRARLGRVPRQTGVVSSMGDPGAELRPFEGLFTELPTNYLASLEDYHRLAFAVLGEARRVATDRFGLRSLAEGFGTPLFEVQMARAGEMECRVWIAGDQLFADEAGIERDTHITTLRSAASFVGIEPGTQAREHDSPELGDVDRWLSVSPAMGHHLSAWFRLGKAVLEELSTAPGAVNADEVQLWPGHFDIATSIGDADAGTRATYGLSPGDATHPHPYVYVGPWADVDRSDPYWGDPAFGGASLQYNQIIAAADPAAAVCDFLIAGFERVST